jgi:hypothetical protein
MALLRHAAEFLVSEESKHINGAELVIDIAIGQMSR